MTDPNAASIDIRTLKAEARRRARLPEGPSYCQALDALARDAGQPHWKALVASVVDVRHVVGPADPSAIAVSPDASRRASAKLNAWISRALDAGSKPDPLSLHAVLRDRRMSMEDRITAAARSIGPMPEADPSDLETAILLVASIAHDAVVQDDLSLMPWRKHTRNLQGDDLLRAVEGMWSAGPPSRPEDAQGEEAWIARIETSTSTWFSAMAASAERKDRSRLARLLTGLAAGDHSRRVGILDLVRPLRLLMERDRAVFEDMIAERYAARTSKTVADHREDARATLDVHLEDEGVAFGDPSVHWDRDLANELADVDMEHWEP